MSKVTLKAPAKVNLMLDIRARRPDGYHDIESVMQTVSLFDTLTLESKPTGIEVSCSVKELICDETNLCHRAAKLFFESVGIDGGVSIFIDKTIPISAGLAGGSTDAAAVLIGLNRLYDTALTTEILCALGSRLGADVPFCIRRGISITRGIGDIFEKCPKMPKCKLLIACDGEGVSTPWAYRRLDEMYDFSTRTSKLDDFTSTLVTADIRLVASKLYNIFESAVFPERERGERLRDLMLERGAIGALMSGSGPSVFGIFEDERTCVALKNELDAANIRAFVCEPYYE